MADAPRVFLSYSHDSDEHADRVLRWPTLSATAGST